MQTTDGKFRQAKILVLSNLPSPYLSPVFSSLAENTNWQLKNCYISKWNEGAGWPTSNASNYIRSADFILSAKPFLIRNWIDTKITASCRLLLHLWREKYDFLLIYGYTQLPQLLLIGWAWLFQIPFTIAGDANYYSDCTRGWKRALKQKWLGWLAHKSAAIITVGVACRKFWESYGASPKKLYHVGFAVDNDFFNAKVVEKKKEAESLKRHLGWEGRTVFIYVGRLIKRKNVDVLISALNHLSELPIALLIVGEGEDRQTLEQLANHNPYVHFVGTASQSELPLYYSLSDALVLPAHAEPWGLVINEAMASGLAIISHQYCGAALDLVSSENGVLLQVASIEEIMSALRLIAQDKNRLKEFKQKSFVRIAEWSISETVRRLTYLIDLNVNQSD